MTVGYLDIISGISGDMMLGACVSAGVPLDHLRDELRKLPLDGYELRQRTLWRSKIAATHIDVMLASSDDSHAAHGNDDHAHEHHHHHGHAHDHHTEPTQQHRHVHRAWADIRALIASSALHDEVKRRALAVFAVLAEAEARVHGVPADDVHFHEVGAVDSIVDIVGTAIALEYLGIERLYHSPVKTGANALIHTQHGMMPVPAPATIELLKGLRIERTGIAEELTTPTGAAILAALSCDAGQAPPTFVPRAIGYGAGTKEFAELPNMLRLIVGEEGVTFETQDLVQLESTIDDMNPELLPWVIERVLSAGALDAFVIPVLGKKGRPAHLLRVIAEPAKREELCAVLFAETSTTGVRWQHMRRNMLPRRQETIHTRYGATVVKRIHGSDGERLVPEYEECRRIAQERNLPLIQVFRSIELDCLSQGHS